MHHPGTTQFDPAGILADATTAALAFEATEIKLRTRLREREIRRPKTRHRVSAEYAPQKLGDCSFQVRHRDAAIPTEPLDLEEHRVVRRIRSIATKHTPRRDHAHRNTPTLHCVNLDGRSLRTKREPVSGVKRVLLGARRMVIRNIERVEIVEVGFNL